MVLAAGVMQAHQAVERGDRTEAEALFAQTVDVTPEMAHEFVVHLRMMVSAPPTVCC